jgi:pimeloyl-ACP methyl ester carboxylesterase
VFILPGILGSNLNVDGERLWLSLHFVNNFERLKWDPASAARVQADGPVGVSYDDLRDHLALTHDVIPFGFDWRRPMEDEAGRLAAMIDAALSARESSQLPVRIVAHSMGGLLARTVQLVRPETWNRMMARSGARVLMLGTPNGGSFAPMQVISGDDSFGELLATVGCLFDDNQARQTIAGMPGLMQLQAALVDSELGLDKAESWQRLDDADWAALQMSTASGMTTSARSAR